MGGLVKDRLWTKEVALVMTNVEVVKDENRSVSTIVHLSRIDKPVCVEICHLNMR